MAACSPRKHPDAQSAFLRGNFRMLVTVQRRVALADKGELEARRDADHVEGDNDISRGQVAMRVTVSDAHDQHALKFVLKGEAGNRAVALLNLRSASMADVGADIGTFPVDRAFGMRAGEFHNRV